jgi:hypothetical protein
VGAKNWVRLCGLRVFVDEVAQSISSKHADVVMFGGPGEWFQGCGLAQGPVRPVHIMVINVFGDGVV